MDDIDQSSNKTFGKKIDIVKNKSTEHPIKKCHYLDGKYFTVIDNSIVEKLGIFNDELYFYQDITADGCIVLYPTKLNDKDD